MVMGSRRYKAKHSYFFFEHSLSFHKDKAKVGSVLPTL